MTLFNATDNPMDATIGNQRLSYLYYTYDQKGQYYIGCRLCPKGILPHEDTSYMGSHQHSEYIPTTKCIVAIFDSHEASREAETLILYDLIKDKNCVNKAIFPFTGKSTLYPTKDPLVRKKLSDTRKSTPLSEKQVEHLEKVNSKQKAEGHPLADKTNYSFFNLQTKETFFGTIFELSRVHCLSLHECHKAKRRYSNSRFRQECSDWVLSSCDLSLGHFSYDTEMTFIHGVNGEFTGTLKSLALHSGSYQCYLEGILKGKERRGWKLNDYLERE